MPAARRPRRPAPVAYFLDVGAREYGDAVLCHLGGRWVLIDGAHNGDENPSPGHRSIPEQLQDLTGTRTGPVHVDLLIVTHCHQDHIGCLPALVAQNLLTADWALVADPGLGWGRAKGDAVPPVPDAPGAIVAAGLREEPAALDADDASIERMLSDARSLEQDYTEMLDALARAGTKVVRHGRDSADALLAAFADIGLSVLGPTQKHLLICAQAIARTTQDLAVRADAAAGRSDAGSPVALYRALAAAGRADADAADAPSRPGPAINLQSIVTCFETGGQRLLFAGDMQFAKPQLKSPELAAELAGLRARIAAQAPFGVVKLSHHGSDNAFDDEVLAELGATSLYGICAGEESASHPNRKVLELLDANRDRLSWARTDRNGLSTIAPKGKKPIVVDHGTINDPRPNSSDLVPQRPAAAPAVLGPAAAIPPAAGAASTAAVAAQSDPVEVVTRIPPGVRRVTVTIDVEPATGAPADGALGAPRTDLAPLAAGRALPPLVFVTQSAALAAQVGRGEAAAALDLVTATGATLVDLPAGTSDAVAAGDHVRAQLAGRPAPRGVVIVGGYAVVPPLRLDTLPPALRAQLGATDDADDFIVWSDDHYADLDGDGIAELPVSRVPDGNSAELLLTALTATAPAGNGLRRGVRNVARPFADTVYDPLPGTAVMAISGPTTPATAPPLDQRLLYFMLHGSWQDTARFWGERSPDDPHTVEAVNITNMQACPGAIALAGCCWGALTVELPAVNAVPGSAPAQHAPEASIALTLLRLGANAFVGCTGSHYSPTEAPYRYFGKPMHDAFWQGVLAGAAPAQALFDAKRAYVAGFPHGQSQALLQAIEYKILNQFTCLGLGW